MSESDPRVQIVLDEIEDFYKHRRGQMTARNLAEAIVNALDGFPKPRPHHPPPPSNFEWPQEDTA